MGRLTGKTGKNGVRAKTQKSDEEKIQQRISQVENFLLEQLTSGEESDSAKVSAAKALYDKLKPTLAAVEQHTLNADIPSEDALEQALNALVAQRPALVDHLIQLREQQRAAESNTTASSATPQ